MPNKELPEAEDINLTGIPDKEVGRIALRSLLEGFNATPEELRAFTLRQMMENRGGFIERLRKSMVSDFTRLDGFGRKEDDGDLQKIAEGVADTLFGVLSGMYPA
jgi:hypothetical protein